MGAKNEKQIAFFMTQRSAEELDKIQKIFAEKEGRVTKAYVLNQAIYHYYEYIKEYYGIEDNEEK
ncbi:MULTISPECIES: hypothetical protein [Lactococcus]|uniref:hypothetical protein n=1 Tax=Lactococcus TaxID=1357 RepID=UPI0007AEABCA|nr:MULTISPECIES: hypothetical protein [Lactococcus]KZK09953.1 hypothetical protein V4_0828 [Lactococcus cremoris]MDU8931471.1 hypothetical protein [Lactococcus cremoris]NMC60607.1 hypothetical protein [Candidatus Methanofastidiosa archaeon]UBU73268.1 hypothetical protein I6G24_12630 [Lactococcus lactis]